MKRRHTFNDFNAADYTELSRKTAVHEAGHAAAIYFGNKQKNLPPIFFQLIVSNCCLDCDSEDTTKIDGGRLIHLLPSSIQEATDNFSIEQKNAYQQAFEADIVNLLVGSLAEANYIALRDNELISPRLIPLQALYNYGGAADLATINDYLICYSQDTAEQERKIDQLFSAAFDFINDRIHWAAIIALTDYILTSDKKIIAYEEITSVLEKCSFQTRRYGSAS